MRLNRPALMLAILGFVSLGAAQSASADTILVFGQNGTASTVTATANGAETQTTIAGTDIAVTLTAIENGASGTQAFFDFTFTSTSAATLNGGDVNQNFSGTFSFNSAADGSGTNYLSGDFSDITVGSGNGLVTSASTPGDTVNFTSSVITSLSLDRAISIAFTSVNPAVAICGTTLCGFTASVAGNFSAELNRTQVPEPATLMLLGTGLAAVAVGARRRRSTKA
jgi:hypothetical protein